MAPRLVVLTSLLSEDLKFSATVVLLLNLSSSLFLLGMSWLSSLTEIPLFCFNVSSSVLSSVVETSL